MNITINGFGRIGRAACKAILQKKNLNLVAVNDLTDAANLAYLLKHDSIYGPYEPKVTAGKNYLQIGKQKILVLAEPDPAKLPWKKLKVDLVIESTGRFLTKELAVGHLRAGARQVILSAPGKDEAIKTIVLGVNEAELRRDDKIISLASCTTNCLAPVSEVIRQKFGIQSALMTTVHSYTADQSLVDGPHHDWRRGRAAGLNLVPTTTGAAQAAAKTIPQLQGKFDGLAVRAPLAVGSLCDTVYLLKKTATVKAVNQALSAAASVSRWRGILAVSHEPLVSSDIVGNPASAIVDLNLTRVIGGNLLKIISWYDNEWGYSNRLADLCVYLDKRKW